MSNTMPLNCIFFCGRERDLHLAGFPRLRRKEMIASTHGSETPMRTRMIHETSVRAGTFRKGHDLMGFLAESVMLNGRHSIRCQPERYAAKRINHPES